MAKPKRLDDDAEQVAVYLNAAERIALNLIGERRKKKSESRTSPSEIVADGVWKILTEVEGIPRTKIEELVRTKSEAVADPSKVTQFRKPD